MPHPQPHQFPQPPSDHPSGRVPKLKRDSNDPLAARKKYPRFVPPPLTNRVNFNLPLSAIMPVDWIQEAGHLVLHMVGDTGGVHGTDVQEDIAHQMEAQVEAASKEDKPAFFYNLGDVVYFNGQSYLYPTQFYEPYQYYTPHILAIPGNHDGDTQVRPGDVPDPEPSLLGFMTNFCDEQPRHLSPYRETMTQPYVYWTLEAPFVTIIGLYSNVDGMLDGRGSFEQQGWLEDQLRRADQSKCLVVTVHHPPYSLDRWHGGAPDILLALDRVIERSGRVPDAVFSGHVHSYQRFTRQRDGHEIPFVVAGAGGYANQPKLMHQIQPQNGNPIDTQEEAFQTKEDDVILASYNDADPGFLRVTIDNEKLVSEYFTVPFADPSSTELVDSFSLNWKSHSIEPSP